MAHPRLALPWPYSSGEDVKTLLPSADVHLARGTITAIEPTVIRTHLRTRRGGSTVKACGRGAGGLLGRAIVTKTKEQVMRGHARAALAGLARRTANTGAILTGLTLAGITARGTGTILAGQTLAAITGTVRPTVAGAEVTAISGATNRRGFRAATVVTQPLAMSGITTTLVGRRGISAKDRVTEFGTGTVAGPGRAEATQTQEAAQSRGSDGFEGLAA